jgi:hypothetical protein
LPQNVETPGASFQLVPKGDEISGETLIKRRDEIDRDYLVSIANYGKIIQQSNRPDFDKAVEGASLLDGGLRSGAAGSAVGR